MKNIPLSFNKEKVTLFLKSDADGYSVFDSKGLTKELGFKRKNINNSVRRHVCSMYKFKRNMYVNNILVQGKNGIDSLEFLYWFGSKLGVVTNNPFTSRRLQSKFLIMSIVNYLYSKE